LKAPINHSVAIYKCLITITHGYTQRNFSVCSLSIIIMLSHNKQIRKMATANIAKSKI